MANASCLVTFISDTLITSDRHATLLIMEPFLERDLPTVLRFPLISQPVKQKARLSLSVLGERLGLLGSSLTRRLRRLRRRFGICSLEVRRRRGLLGVLLLMGESSILLCSFMIVIDGMIVSIWISRVVDLLITTRLSTKLGHSLLGPQRSGLLEMLGRGRE